MLKWYVVNKFNNILGKLQLHGVAIAMKFSRIIALPKKIATWQQGVLAKFAGRKIGNNENKDVMKPSL